ncbi:MAG: hypothetical protein OEW79_12645, partial [Betaproteobacteria bacterium]|nr:hypothetical protein [Betaproteobacteria bacterium]
DPRAFQGFSEIMRQTGAPFQRRGGKSVIESGRAWILLEAVSATFETGATRLVECVRPPAFC